MRRSHQQRCGVRGVCIFSITTVATFIPVVLDAIALSQGICQREFGPRALGIVVFDDDFTPWALSTGLDLRDCIFTPPYGEGPSRGSRREHGEAPFGAQRRPPS